MRDCKKGFISISVVYAFLILFVFLMLAILASYISRENLLSKLIGQSKDIIYKDNNKEDIDNNITIKIFVDGIYSKLFPSSKYYSYNPDTSYCNNGAILEFDKKHWDASASKITGKTTCVIEFVSKNSNLIPGGEDYTEEVLLYEEEILNGADPVLKRDLIPVIIEQDETDGWKVTYADITKEWYKYEDSEWANAVRLVDTPSTTYGAGMVIDHEDISAYFVWIPKFKYKLFNMGNYNSYVEGELEPKNQLIKIKFGGSDTKNSDTSCKTPMESGASGSCAVGKWMTHPAFISFDSTGFWVGKFETTGSINNISILPKRYPLTNETVKSMFDGAYSFYRLLDSHMMKNIEWGAVAYLTNSIYGKGNSEVWIAGTNRTGWVSGDPDGTDPTIMFDWYSTTGLNGSTSGNITGIYDMSGGVWEYVAAYIDNLFGDSGFTVSNINNYDLKYFDIYSGMSDTNLYSYRILGDATGEMGPFRHQSSLIYGSWYGDTANFVTVTTEAPWFRRGGYAESKEQAGLFHFQRSTGLNNEYRGFRLVLTPK